MIIIYCYLERENYKVYKFHRNYSAYFQISPLPLLSAASYSFEIK